MTWDFSNMDKAEMLGRIRGALERVYGGRLHGVVLYGSIARGDAGPDSDVDVLVLLEPPLHYGPELDRITDTLYPLSLEWGRCISGKPALSSDYLEAVFPLYQSAQRDGIRV